ncbi:MAG: hypothetical protein GXW99_05175 [Clostridiales bacterium]|nr:hypothetical protein [Clostridiales bacterium]
MLREIQQGDIPLCGELYAKAFPKEYWGVDWSAEGLANTFRITWNRSGLWDTFMRKPEVFRAQYLRVEKSPAAVKKYILTK